MMLTVDDICSKVDELFGCPWIAAQDCGTTIKSDEICTDTCKECNSAEAWKRYFEIVCKDGETK